MTKQYLYRSRSDETIPREPKFDCTFGPFIEILLREPSRIGTLTIIPVPFRA